MTEESREAKSKETCFLWLICYYIHKDKKSKGIILGSQSISAGIRKTPMKTKDFLNLLGLVPFSLDQTKIIEKEFSGQIASGLKGLPASLKMIPALIPPVKEKNLSKNQNILVVDVGGSGLRISPALKTKRGLSFQIFEANFPKVHWQAKEFFNFLATQIKKVVDLSKIDALGLIFSYPARAQKTVDGVDVWCEEKLTKDWEIKEISQNLVGQQLLSSLSLSKKHLPLLVMNDTIAVLCSCPKALIGAVVGTGFNLAAIIDNQIYNFEAGNFQSPSLPLCRLAQLFDLESENPGQQLAEKQLSGLGVGGQFKIFVREAAKSPKLFPILGKNWNLVHPSNLDLILKEKWGQLPFYFSSLTKKEKSLLFLASQILTQRSAQILASFLAATFKITKASKINKMTIPVEGKFFWRSPNYYRKVQNYLRGLTPEAKYRFTGRAKRLGLEGAMRAVASYCFTKGKS